MSCMCRYICGELEDKVVTEQASNKRCVISETSGSTEQELVS